MSNGYRGLAATALVAVVLIAFGLGAFVSGLDYPEQRYQAYQDSKANESGPLLTVANVATPVVERTPCNQPKSESESDLCAQWRAAKAAERSADWTVYEFWATLVGIALLTWQIVLTREAVKDTGDATIAMREANSISRDAAQRQLRPYVFIETVKPKVLSPSDNEISIVIRNFGSTPACNVRTKMSYRRCRVGQAIARLITLKDADRIRDMAPQHSYTMSSAIEVEDWAETIQRITDNEITLILNWAYSYESDDGIVYGPFHETVIYGKGGPRQPDQQDNLTYNAD